MSGRHIAFSVCHRHFLFSTPGHFCGSVMTCHRTFVRGMRRCKFEPRSEPAASAFSLLLRPLTTRAMIQARHDHGGAADGTGNSTGSSVFHFTGGDVIWFTGWAPSSPGAIAGAAIGLFLLAIVERWLAAMRIVMEAWWMQKCVNSSSAVALLTVR